MLTLFAAVAAAGILGPAKAAGYAPPGGSPFAIVGPSMAGPPLPSSVHVGHEIFVAECQNARGWYHSFVCVKDPTGGSVALGVTNAQNNVWDSFRNRRVPIVIQDEIGHKGRVNINGRLTGQARAEGFRIVQRVPLTPAEAEVAKSVLHRSAGLHQARPYQMRFPRLANLGSGLLFSDRCSSAVPGYGPSHCRSHASFTWRLFGAQFPGRFAGRFDSSPLSSSARLLAGSAGRFARRAGPGVAVWGGANYLVTEATGDGDAGFAAASAAGYGFGTFVEPALPWLKNGTAYRTAVAGAARSNAVTTGLYSAYYVHDRRQEQAERISSTLGDYDRVARHLTNIEDIRSAEPPGFMSDLWWKLKVGVSMEQSGPAYSGFWGDYYERAFGP